MITDPTKSEGESLTLGFVGTCAGYAAPLVRAFEDEVLALLPDHGARALFRGHRSPDQPETLPVEMHILWFPNHAAFDAYIADPRRLDIIGRHGDLFDTKTVVRLDPIA